MDTNSRQAKQNSFGQPLVSLFLRPQVYKSMAKHIIILVTPQVFSIFQGPDFPLRFDFATLLCIIL